MNQVGQVVGWSKNSSGAQRAFLYDSDPVNLIIDLNTRLPAGSPVLTSANAINGNGEIAAYILANPVRAGLMQPGEVWPYSGGTVMEAVTGRS